jgi:hypothetical protein
VTRDLHNHVYALVELVDVGTVDRMSESYIRPAKIHITTARVPVRVESVGFPYDEVVLP